MVKSEQELWYFSSFEINKFFDFSKISKFFVFSENNWKNDFWPSIISFNGLIKYLLTKSICFLWCSLCSFIISINWINDFSKRNSSFILPLLLSLYNKSKFFEYSFSIFIKELKILYNIWTWLYVKVNLSFNKPKPFHKSIANDIYYLFLFNFYYN